MFSLRGALALALCAAPGALAAPLVGSFQVVGTVCYEENMEGSDKVKISEWTGERTTAPPNP